MAKVTKPHKLYVQEWIVALGRTAAEVARESGINEGYLSSLGRGGKDNPSLRKLTEIANALGLSPAYLLVPPESVLSSGTLPPIGAPKSPRPN